MPQRGGSARTLGLVLAFLGTFALSVGLARAPFLPALLGLDGWLLATLQGAILLFVGILVLLLVAPPAVEEAAGITPATVAFATRAAQPLPIPARAAGPRAGHDAKPPHARHESLRRMDDEIRDLTRRISKAGVLLATGQLSQAGYVHYVEDLKRRLAELEASRVRAELAMRRV